MFSLNPRGISVIYLDKIIRQIEQQNLHIERFVYADDVAQTARSKEDLKRVMEQWDTSLSEYGLKFSYEKTEYMVIGTREEDRLEINGHNINKTEKFTYLGSSITSNGKMETEINGRIAKYSKNVGALYPLLRDRHIPKRIKTHIKFYTKTHTAVCLRNMGSDRKTQIQNPSSRDESPPTHLWSHKKRESETSP